MRTVIISIFSAAVLLLCAPPPGTHLVPLVPARLAPADSITFAGNLNDAVFLAGYARDIGLMSDSVRVQATAAVRTRLGQEWFCFPGDDRLTHAVFGKYDTLRGTYDAVFHYAVDTAGTVFRQRRLPGLASTLPRARAVCHALALAGPLAQRGQVRFDPYVRTMPGGALQVVMLPGTDPDGTLTYGGECRFNFTADGTVLTDSSALFDGIRGFMPGRARRASLVNRSRNVPTAGQLCFVLVNRTLFDDIRIENRATLTHFHKGPDGTYRWSHSVKHVTD